MSQSRSRLVLAGGGAGVWRARATRLIALCLVCFALAGCNDHPLLPLETALSGGMRETVDYPHVSNVDFLFVVDDSGSMAEEQANLAQNFEALSGLFATGLRGRANVRVAVTDTDLQNPDRRGAFVTPDDPDCAGVGPVLSLAVADPGMRWVMRACLCRTPIGRGRVLDPWVRQE